MPLTTLQKEALANELIDVMERFQLDTDQHYQAKITQPSTDHLVIKLQLADSAELWRRSCIRTWQNDSHRGASKAILRGRFLRARSIGSFGAS